jgi:hypothetical protein
MVKLRQHLTWYHSGDDSSAEDMLRGLLFYRLLQHAVQIGPAPLTVNSLLASRNIGSDPTDPERERNGYPPYDEIM